MPKNAKHAWYVDEFKKRLCDSDRCPSMSSLRAYAYSMLWLEARMDFPEAGGVPKPEDVLEYLENAKVTAVRRASVYTALKKWHGCHNEKGCSDKYSKPLIRAKHGVDDQYRNQKRTAKQERNWVEYPKLKAFANQLRDEVLQFDKHHFWTREQFVKAQLCFILQFHLRFPIRRDLATVKWSTRADKQWGVKDNYIDNKRKMVILNCHKTCRHSGPKEIPLNRLLWRLWGMLRIQHKKRGWEKMGHVLLSYYYKPMTPNGYSQWLQREMKRCPGCEKKAIGCMIIRHCCITHKRRHEMTDHEKQTFADKCMHSTARNNLYRTHKSTPSQVV